MPTKKNFLGGQQNYNEKTGEYESCGKVVEDADGDGVKHESKSIGKRKVKYQKTIREKDGKLIKAEETEAYNLENGLGMNIEKNPDIFRDGKVYDVVDLESGTIVSKATSYEDALKQSQNKEFISEIQNRKNELFGKEKLFTGDKFLSNEHLDYLFDKFDGDEDAVLDEIRRDPEYQKSEITNSDLQGIVEVYQMKKSFNSINRKRMGY